MQINVVVEVASHHKSCCCHAPHCCNSSVRMDAWPRPSLGVGSLDRGLDTASGESRVAGPRGGRGRGSERGDTPERTQFTTKHT